MTKRIPIIERNPVITDDLLIKDVNSYESMEEVVDQTLSDFDEAQTTWGDNLYSLEDAFTRRFASLWALKYKPLKGKPLTFLSKTNPYKHRPWQQQILDDNHPNKCVEKSRQLGLSELSVTECIHFLTVHPQTKIMYTFPTYHQMNEFSTTRVDPVFKDSEYLASILSKAVHNVSTKKVGQSYLLMRSSSSGSIGEGADVDSA